MYQPAVGATFTSVDNEYKLKQLICSRQVLALGTLYNCCTAGFHSFVFPLYFVLGHHVFSGCLRHGGIHPLLLPLPNVCHRFCRSFHTNLICHPGAPLQPKSYPFSSLISHTAPAPFSRELEPLPNSPPPVLYWIDMLSWVSRHSHSAHLLMPLPGRPLSLPPSAASFLPRAINMTCHFTQTLSSLYDFRFVVSKWHNARNFLQNRVPPWSIPPSNALPRFHNVLVIGPGLFTAQS